MQSRPATPDDLDEILRLARIMFTALGIRDAPFLDLHASPDGESLYRSMGLAENERPELRLRVLPAPDQ